jgi:ketosteroid isomerase-like protein
MKALFNTVCLVLTVFASFGQGDATASNVLEINQRIDAGIVDKDIGTLEKLYASDLVFTHGTGTVDDKESWLRSVSRPEQKFVSRVHDSTGVELHNDIALVHGILTVTRLDGRKEVRYKLWYLRIFRQREDTWELISHRTTHEIHL